MLMREPVTKNLEGANKKAFILGNENKICELVSLILDDLGFNSMQISETDWLLDTVAHVNPELIVWDLGHEEELELLQSLSAMRKKVSMKKVRVMLLGGPDVKKDIAVSGADINIRFCLKPFSPARLRREIEELYGTESGD